MSRLAACLTFAAALVLTPALYAAQEWGTVKGQVVWTPDKLPVLAPIVVPAPVPACVKGGVIPSEKYVVDPKSKGVRWAMVWLLDASGDYKKAIPINPALAAVPKDNVVIDQPCCGFEPRVIGLREGQKLIVRNSAPFAHNTNIQAAAFNEVIAPKTEKEIPAFPPERLPVPVACNIHPWMTGWIGEFKHPYFAVTDENGKFEIKDAPAGTYHIIAWQESVGFLSKGRRNGEPIKIKANDVTEVKFDLTPTD